MANRNNENPFAQVPQANIQEWLEKMKIQVPAKETVKEATNDNGEQKQ